MEELAGYFFAVMIGLSLGLIGSGGSILTVPILVYLFNVSPVMATAYSLFIVGATSLAGAASNLRQKTIDIKVAVLFALPSLIAVFLVRRFLMPAIPEIVFTTASFSMTKDLLIMLVFSILMILTSFSMIRKRKTAKEVPAAGQKLNLPFIMAEGTLVGGLTGFVGAGGGFLIIPALVLLSNIPMKTAVGTSLLIIAIKSLFGFMGDLHQAKEMDWSLLLLFTLLSLFGIFIGSQLGKKISGEKLKPAFGWFVLAMGIYIILKEIFENN